MVVGAKVCEVTDGFLWFVCGNFDVSHNTLSILLTCCVVVLVRPVHTIVYQVAQRRPPDAVSRGRTPEAVVGVAGPAGANGGHLIGAVATVVVGVTHPALGDTYLTEGEGGRLSYYGPRPLKSTGRHGHFLNSTCDIGPSDMRQGLKIVVTWDIAFS